MDDAILIIWLFASFLWDILVFSTTTYVVFWKDRSGWWFVLAMALTYNHLLFKALSKRFNMEDED